MFELLKRLWPFGKKDFSAERYDEFDKAKEAALERILGPMDDIVGHALIPFGAGGTFDMYYFSSCMPGTVFATMELIDPDGNGPKPNILGTYEFVTCTKLKNTNTLEEGHKERLKRIEEGHLTSFEKMEQRMCSIMTTLGRYSYSTALKHGDTAEVPYVDGDKSAYVIFDKFDSKEIPFEIEGKKHGLLLIMEVFLSELEYARKNRTRMLIDKLKTAGFYPYSDMDREAVV